MSGVTWTRGTAESNGLSLAWEATGPENGEPVVLVMGLACQLIHWPDALAAELVGRGFRVLRFDNRDIGLSDDGDHGIRFSLRGDFVRIRLGMRPGPANYLLHDMAADTVGFLDAMGIPKAHIVGASMGGMIAQITAARFPARVKSLTSIMSSTNHPWVRQSRIDLLMRMSKPAPDQSRDTMVERSVETFRLIGSPGYPTSDDERRLTARRAYDRAFRPGGVMRQMHAIVATGSFEDLLGDVRSPTQVIHGTSDPLVRASAGRRTAQLIRGAQLELIEGMGHDCPVALMPRWTELIAANAGRA